MKDKRVLVTGGSGFIGSHLVKNLLERGAKVAVMVRYDDVVKNIRLANCWSSIEVIEADLRNRGALEAIRRFEPQVVFHLAAYHHVGQSFGQVEECFDVNAKGTANLFDVCTSVAKFVYIATSEVYGRQETVPFVETMEPNPVSPYAITKYAGEMYCHMKQRIGGDTSIILLRPFNAFGPYQSAKAIIAELIIKCLRGEPIRTTLGEQTREFNFVANLIDGMLLAAEYKERIDGPINIAAGEEVAIRDLAYKIVELTKSHSKIEIGALPYRPNEIWRMRGDAPRARNVLGWWPRVSLDEGLVITADWYREQLMSGNPAVCTACRCAPVGASAKSS
jgi:nucleoside-diphosphate-sugar epimerase